MPPMHVIVSGAVIACSTALARAEPPSTAAQMASLTSAAVAVGDWRLHPADDAPRRLDIAPLFSVDVRGLHTNRNRLGLAAGAVALVGALLIASERSGNWCRGAGCDLGAIALLAAAPLLEAAAHDEQDR